MLELLDLLTEEKKEADGHCHICYLSLSLDCCVFFLLRSLQGDSFFVWFIGVSAFNFVNSSSCGKIDDPYILEPSLPILHSSFRQSSNVSVSPS
jgi:hypothetical protein